MRRSRSEQILRMVELAILTAVVLVLQTAGIAIPNPLGGTPISLVLIPIALGAMILGPSAGAWLGLVFGAQVYITLGVMHLDPLFTGVMFDNHPVITALICLGKSTLAGFLAGVVYRVLSKKNEWLAIFAAAAITPVVNTGIFVLGCLTIYGTMEQLAPAGQSVMYFLIIGCAGFNFVFEFAVNMLLAPALRRIVSIVTRKKIRS
ncbi:MAG: ECF transporter S component [Clostridia bacterium]|nr:ECF transporter S component [Clostridia bacterium]